MGTWGVNNGAQVTGVAQFALRDPDDVRVDIFRAIIKGAHAYLWQFGADGGFPTVPGYGPGALMDLGTLPGGYYSVGRGINELGEVVGWGHTGPLPASASIFPFPFDPVATNDQILAAPFHIDAFYYGGGPLMDLGRLPNQSMTPGVILFSHAYAINNH